MAEHGFAKEASAIAAAWARGDHGEPHQPGDRVAGARPGDLLRGGHTGHPLFFDRGRQDAHTWADYIYIGMEHGSFDMAGLAEYMRGLIEGADPLGPPYAGRMRPHAYPSLASGGATLRKILRP
jgi:hypothetical protein